MAPPKVKRMLMLGIVKESNITQAKITVLTVIILKYWDHVNSSNSVVKLSCYTFSGGSVCGIWISPSELSLFAVGSA